MTKKNRGYCNVCRAQRRLTNDHVPPQGSYSPRRVWVQSVAPKLESPDARVRQRKLSQNGLKFREACSRCNSKLLGRRYDPEMHCFTREVACVMRASKKLTLPARVDIPYKPERLSRAVVGHLLAAEERTPKKRALAPRAAPMLDAMRQYFLDEREELPPELRLFFWPYRALRVTILRGVVIVFNFGKPSSSMVSGDFLKFFPVAFWLTYKAPSRVTTQISDREIDPRGLSVDDVATIGVPTADSDTFRADWPERPDSRDGLFLNDRVCVYAEPEE